MEAVVTGAGGDTRIRRYLTKHSWGSIGAPMVKFLFEVMHNLVRAVPTFLFIAWIVSLADPDGRWVITRWLNAISQPFFRLVTGMLPRIGQLDISPILIVLMSFVVDQMLYVLY